MEDKIPVPKITAFLADINGFSAISQEELHSIAERMTVQVFKPGDYLMRHGQIGQAMYIIWEGSLQVFVVVDGADGATSVATIEPKQIVGEMALLTNEPRNANVIAKTHGVALVLHRDTIIPLLYDHPKMANFLTEILAQRIDQAGGIRQIGRYNFSGVLGRGTTAKVFDGTHKDLNRPVAIKMLRHGLVYNRAFHDRFLLEAKVIAKLSHPNIIQIYDMETLFGTYFIVMEKIKGVDLKTKLEKSTRLAPCEAIEFLLQIGRAVAYAHKNNVVHRDIKPANCLVDENNSIKLVDFGVSRMLDAEDMAAHIGGKNRSESIEGSPPYLAPELILGTVKDEKSVDFYAMGILAFELLTGQVPFNSKNIRDVLIAHIREPVPDISKIVANLPQPLIDFINGVLIKDPKKRLADWNTIFYLLGQARKACKNQADDSKTIGVVTSTVHFTYPVAVAKIIKDTLNDLSQMEGVSISWD